MNSTGYCQCPVQIVKEILISAAEWTTAIHSPGLFSEHRTIVANVLLWNSIN